MVTEESATLFFYIVRTFHSPRSVVRYHILTFCCDFCYSATRRCFHQAWNRAPPATNCCLSRTCNETYDTSHKSRKPLTWSVTQVIDLWHSSRDMPQILTFRISSREFLIHYQLPFYLYSDKKIKILFIWYLRGLKFGTCIISSNYRLRLLCLMYSLFRYISGSFYTYVI